MKFKLIFILYTFLSIGSFVLAQAYPKLDDIDIKIGDYLGYTSDENKDLSWITEEVRPIVVDKLLKKMKSDDDTEREVAEDCLVSISHTETLQKVFERMLRGDRGTPLESYATEEALPYLMRGVELGSPERVPTEPGSDLTNGPVRSNFATAASNVIENRNVFPEETRRWASKISASFYGTYVDARIDLLKQWWAHNEKAVREKRYNDATWLPLYKGKPSYISDEEIEERKADQERERLARRSFQEEAATGRAKFVKNTPAKTLWVSLLAFAIFLASLIGWKIKAAKKARKE